MEKISHENCSSRNNNEKMTHLHKLLTIELKLPLK